MKLTRKLILSSFELLINTFDFRDNSKSHPSRDNANHESHANHKFKITKFLDFGSGSSGLEYTCSPHPRGKKKTHGKKIIISLRTKILPEILGTRIVNNIS